MNRRLRALLPFAGCLSCPCCGHRFVSVQDRMMRLPKLGRPAPCPGCKVLLCYPKWVDSLAIIWVVYVFAMINVIFAASSLPAWVFLVMINGFLPLGALTLGSMAWGWKLREWVRKGGSSGE